MTFKLGNAPCSWGTIEGTGTESERISYVQMLDELVESGYLGTELGDYGFMPTEAVVLRRELESRALTMLGAYVDVALKDPAALLEGCERVLSIARLLKSVTDVGDPGWQPFLILADAHSRDPVRFQNAGRVTPEMALTDSEMKVFAENANEVARSVQKETELRTVFHHHCAGFVETPEEIERFLSLTDPELLGLLPFREWQL
jgi:inosose dehydratase